MGSKHRTRPRRITVEQLDSQCSAPRESHFSPFLERSSPFVPPCERIVGERAGGEARRAIETTKKSRFRKLVKRYKGKGSLAPPLPLSCSTMEGKNRDPFSFLLLFVSPCVPVFDSFFSLLVAGQTQMHRLFIKTLRIRIHIYIFIYRCDVFTYI